MLSGLAAGYGYDEVLSQILDDSRQPSALAAAASVAPPEPAVKPSNGVGCSATVGGRVRRVGGCIEKAANGSSVCLTELLT